MSLNEVLAVLADVHGAFSAWRGLSFAARGACFTRLANLMRAEIEPCATLMAQEMGKPVLAARGEVEKCIGACEHFATQAASYLAHEPIPTEAHESSVVFEPLGVILAIMPWNFPFWQVFRFAAPALMAGNTALLKHSPNTTGCGLMIEDLFRRAGFPRSVFRTVVVDVESVEALIADPRVAAVTLTGSPRAGAAVARVAGAHLKKTVLELGGSDPYLVLEDADLDQAAELCVASRMNNAGQTCIAAKRLIVRQEVFRGFLERVVRGMSAFVMGDPLHTQTMLGPLARSDLRDVVHRQVSESVAQGATLVMGGVLPPGPGFFYPPTVLVDVKPGMPVLDEEVFGPVAVLLAVTDDDEALRLANDTRYGLGAAVFTRDLTRGRRLIQRLDAGNCVLNGMVKSDPRLPFGGIRHSGYGRELGALGIKEFTNIKTVYIK